MIAPTSAVDRFMMFHVEKLGKEERERGEGMKVDELLGSLEMDDLIA